MKLILILSLFYMAYSSVAMANVANVGTLNHVGYYFGQNPVFPIGKNQNNVVGFGSDSNRMFYTYYDNLGGIHSSAYYHATLGKTAADIVAVTFAEDDYRTITWYKDQTYTIGNFVDLDAYQFPMSYSLPSSYADLSVQNIVGMGIDKAVGSLTYGKVYTWFKNGHYTIGTYSDLDSVSGPQPYVIQQGQGDIIAMDFWSYNTTVSLHSSTTAHRVSYSVGESHFFDNGYGLGFQHAKLPAGYQPDSIVAMSVWIDGNQEKVVTWFDDDMKSIGTYQDLGYYGMSDYDLQGPFHPSGTYDPEDILDIGVNASGTTYTYLKDGAFMVGDLEILSEYEYGPYSVPAGRLPGSIIGIGSYGWGILDSASIDVWYNDNLGSMPVQHSLGTLTDLDYYGLHNVIVYGGKTSADVIGVTRTSGPGVVVFYKHY